ncbi:hypothetical protein F4802DRAFT_379685 [Xylaria palmicola]|nr:hypothetical protein F4802DRAFT_379685 [Xylaria palmicola]
MAGDAVNGFGFIAEAATASWYAHRGSVPASKQSQSIGHDSTQEGTDARASTSMTAPPASAVATPVEYSPLADEESASGASAASPTPTRTASRGASEARASGGGSIHSDITAWQSTLQTLPPEFAPAQVPLHPLAQALAEQPTLRPVEWNRFRQQGGFVPRTAHDYGSLMIYLSGQVNPNPCRNCVLRNGPYARCVVSPPAVLAQSLLRHACANCTYQNQYKKCTNAPISEEEKARSELSRPLRIQSGPISHSGLTPRTNPRKTKANSKTKPNSETGEHHIPGHTKNKLKRKRQQPDEMGDISMTQTVTGLDLGPGNNLESFDAKLQRIRACSPRSRRRVAAQILQWKAALATVEAEEPAPIPGPAPPALAQGATINTYQGAPLNGYTASYPISTSSAVFMKHTPAANQSAGPETISYGAEDVIDYMDEDDSYSEQDDDNDEDEDDDTPEPAIKAPR